MSAAVSALAVLFAWGFVASAIGKKAAMIAAWIIALYPEAVLLGASQMREPFLIAALAAALYGYSRIRKGEFKEGIAIVVASALIIALPISPPFVIVIFAIVASAWFWEGLGIGRRRNLFVLALLGVVVLAALALVVRAWADLDAIAGSPWEIIREWWVNAGDQWRVTLVSEQSFWLDNLLKRLPSNFRIPFLVLYGLIQPFLPAALIAPGAPIWRSIGIWRSLGWFLMLPFLLYGTWLAFRLYSLQLRLL
jgi:4-amino-4-deoxy-L-arabinose transferase-like glycosyltransferase